MSFFPCVSESTSFFIKKFPNLDNMLAPPCCRAGPWQICRRSLSAASLTYLTTSSATRVCRELGRYGVPHSRRRHRCCSWTTTTIQPSAASPPPSSVATVTSILMLCSCGLYPIPSGKLCPAACRSSKITIIPWLGLVLVAAADGFPSLSALTMVIVCLASSTPSWPLRSSCPR